MAPDQAIQRLKEGNARFVANQPKARNWTAKVVATAHGQHPFAAVLGCMDSRAPIEVVFDQGIGDVFGVRIAGNVVNEDELGSLEYAVSVVGVKLPSCWGTRAAAPSKARSTMRSWAT
jgi:carbonic anhydrase